MASTEESTLTPDEARISVALANDRPTIDAAVKSFLSLICARSMTASMTDQDVQSRVLMGVISAEDSNAVSNSNGLQSSQQALQVARIILQSCNSFEFAIHKTVLGAFQDKPGMTAEKKENLLELSVVARLWNGLVQSKQKPTRFLGRKALLHAWLDLKVVSALPCPTDDVDAATKAVYLQQLAWIQEFERHLLHQHDPNSTMDNDAALIWDNDGGEAELTRRRQRRQLTATERGPITPS